MPETPSPRTPHHPAVCARWELLAVLIAMVAICAEPLGVLLPFAGYALLVAGYAFSRRVPLPRLLARTARIAPILLLLAAGLPASQYLDAWLDSGSAASIPWTSAAWAPSLSLFLRSVCAVSLLAALVIHLGFHQVLAGLRALGLPVAVVYTLNQMERYRGLIAGEWRRTTFARESRSPGGTQFALASYAGQAGMIFLRSWERAERIHAAMLSRGFSLEAQRPASAASPSLPHPAQAASLLWLPVAAIAIRLGSLAGFLRW